MVPGQAAAGADVCRKKCCILVLCGMPASGKTTLARLLKDRLTGRSLNNCSGLNFPCNAHHICYDELMPPNVEKLLIEERVDETGDSSTTTWKKFRRAILTCTENAISKSDSGVGADMPHSLRAEELSARYTSMLQTSPSEGQDMADIFIIDDNMYYAGMRYEYYKLAKKYNISFAQVCVICSVNEALQRNSTRQNAVPENVIKTMAEKMEMPETSTLWESHSVTLDGEKEIAPQLDLVFRLISASLADPVKDLLAELEIRKDEARSETLASVMHQIDQVLRRVVSEIIKEAKECGATGAEVKSLSSKLRDTKQEIVQLFKSGSLELNEDELSQGFQSTSQRSLFHRLKCLIREKCDAGVT